MSGTLPTVALLNSNEDTLEMLRACFQDHGFSSVVIGHVNDIKAGRTDFLEFMRVHDPRVLVWDIAIPYDENWRFVHTLMQNAAAAGRRFVLTTTNKRALDALVGPNSALEIVGKPYDLEQIVAAVRRALG